MSQIVEYVSILEKHRQARAEFHEQFEKTLAYRLLAPMAEYNASRLKRLEEICWEFRRSEARGELKGAPALRALGTLSLLREQTRELIWLTENEMKAIDHVAESLINAASTSKKGRRRDSLGQTFRRIMGIFFLPALPTKDGCRALSREEKDEILCDLFKLTMGRTVSFESFVRMRKRERAAEKEEFLARLQSAPDRTRA